MEAAEVFRYLLLREELVYSVEEAPLQLPAPRWSRSIVFAFVLLPVMYDIHRRLGLMRSSKNKRGGFSKHCSVIASVQTEHLLKAMALHGERADIRELIRSPEVDVALKKALASVLAASANVLGTEGHRSQIRLRGHELAGTTARPICSSRPTWQSHERPFLQLQQQNISGEVEGFAEPGLGAPQWQSCGEPDPVLQARFFHEMMRLFFEELLGTLPPMARASYHVGAGDRCTLTSSACFWGTTWAHDSAAFNRVLPYPAIENAKPFAVEAFCHFKSCHLFSACWSAAC
ncbi:unnamed protein product [Effrenium voratum]|nr:unnamed protein product [Effrenium voratum]